MSMFNAFSARRNDRPAVRRSRASAACTVHGEHLKKAEMPSGGQLSATGLGTERGRPQQRVSTIEFMRAEHMDGAYKGWS